MGIRVNYGLIFSLLLVVNLLSSCQQTNPAENIYRILEKVVTTEKGFEEQQAPLENLEKNENDTYNEIIGLGMKQYIKIVQLSDNAITMADQRKIYIEKETVSIENAEKEFKTITPYIGELKDEKLKKTAQELYTLMMNRYKAHDELYKAYLNSITNDKQLYEMFKDKNITLDQLEKQVNKVNSSYRETYADNNQFNKWTRQYNNKKLEFYKLAGLKSK